MKNKHSVSRTAIVALLLLLTICFQACGGESVDESSATSSAKSEAPVASSQPAEPSSEQSEEPSDYWDVRDSVPDNLRFEDTTVTILVRDEDLFRMEFGTEEIENSGLNTLLIDRTRQVEERLGVDIKTIPLAIDAGSYAPVNFNQKLIVEITAGNTAFDAVASYAYYGVQLGNSEYFYNLRELPYLDFTKPWWNQDYVNEMTINNKLFFVTGDIAFTSVYYTYATYFNKTLAERWCNGVNLYDVVDNGDWTLDYFAQLVKNIYEETDGVDGYSDGDFYGAYIPTASEPLDALFMGSGLHITEKGRDSMPKLDFYNENTVAFFDKMYDIFFNNKGVRAGEYTGESIFLARQKFCDQESVFLFSALMSSELLREVEFNYGLLPIPKADKQQEEYYTCPADCYSIISVPICVDEEKLDAIGATLELLAAESYRYVTPQYFNNIIKYGYLDTDEDSRMYEKLLANVRYDFGVVNSISIDNVQHLVRTILALRGKDFTSAYTAVEDGVEILLDELLDNYRDN